MLSCREPWVKEKMGGCPLFLYRVRTLWLMTKLGEGMNQKFWGMNRIVWRLSYITLPLPPPIKGGEIPVI
jgi:hypothetical protein